MTTRTLYDGAGTNAALTNVVKQPHHFSAFLVLSGHLEEGLQVADKLARIDPLSPIGPFVRETGLFFAGRWAEALRADSAVKRIDPTMTYFDAIDGTSQRELGHLPESLAAYRAYEALRSAPSFGVAATLTKMGRREDAQRALAALEQRAARQWVDPMSMAIAYAGVGDRENTYRWIEDGFAKKSFQLRILMPAGWHPFAAFEQDPRFVALRNRVLATTHAD